MPYPKQIKKRSAIWTMPKNEFEALVKKSQTLSDILRTLGFSNKGGNAKTLKRRIKEDGIDISHISLGRNANRGKSYDSNYRNTRIPLEDLLVENCKYKVKNQKIKLRLIKNGLIKDECSCGLKDEWHGKKLVLVLDHKNGIADDNRLKNLRIICPNCHSQTETFCRTNKNPESSKGRT